MGAGRSRGRSVGGGVNSGAGRSGGWSLRGGVRQACRAARRSVSVSVWVRVGRGVDPSGLVSVGVRVGRGVGPSGGGVCRRSRGRASVEGGVNLGAGRSGGRLVGGGVRRRNRGRASVGGGVGWGAGRPGGRLVGGGVRRRNRGRASVRVRRREWAPEGRALGAGGATGRRAGVPFTGRVRGRTGRGARSVRVRRSDGWSGGHPLRGTRPWRDGASRWRLFGFGSVQGRLSEARSVRGTSAERRSIRDPWGDAPPARAPSEALGQQKARRPKVCLPGSNPGPLAPNPGLPTTDLGPR